jgi:hypothetical protein
MTYRIGILASEFTVESVKCNGALCCERSDGAWCQGSRLVGGLCSGFCRGLSSRCLAELIQLLDLRNCNVLNLSTKLRGQFFTLQRASGWQRVEREYIPSHGAHRRS